MAGSNAISVRNMTPSFTARSCHLVSNSGQNAVCLPPSVPQRRMPHPLARSPSKQHLQALLTEYGTGAGGLGRARAYTCVTPHFIPLDRTQSWRGNRLSHVELKCLKVMCRGLPIFQAEQTSSNVACELHHSCKSSHVLKLRARVAGGRLRTLQFAMCSITCLPPRALRVIANPPRWILQHDI